MQARPVAVGYLASRGGDFGRSEETRVIALALIASCLAGAGWALYLREVGKRTEEYVEGYSRGLQDAARTIRAEARVAFLPRDDR